MGIRLFERTTRKVELTEAGQDFLSRIERPLGDLEDASTFIRDLVAGRRGRIVFALLPSVAFGYAIDALADFKATYPNITVRLIEDQNENLIQKVLQNEVDFAIGSMTHEMHQLSFRKMMVDEPLVVFPKTHRFSRQSRVTWKDLVSEPLALLPRLSSLRGLAEVAFARMNIRLEPEYEIANMVTAMCMARAGMAVTILPGIALSELNMTGLQSARIHAPLLPRDIGIITRSDRTLAPAAKAYVALLLAASASDSLRAPRNLRS
jgi:LysR family carnitine catabolism transcriptional activator